MNARIQELLIESGFRIFGTKIVAGDFGSSGNATACSQKFAQLIIQECNNIVLSTSVEGGAELLRGTIATRIQNTLGVEK